MYSYTAYGLGFRSALPLPELIAVPGDRVDVTIQLGKVDSLLPKVGAPESYFHIVGEKAYFFWDQVGAFLVRSGKEITVDPLPQVEERLIRLPLLGAVLATLLDQRGATVLHSSAIAVQGAAVALLGNKGSGKSTIAAALYAQGHQLVADDVVALDVNDATEPMAMPGFGQLKLWPGAAAASLGDDPEELPRLHSRADKRARQVISRLVQEPVPLRQIYVLDRGSTPQIERFQPQETMIQLIANLYVARFGQQSLHAKGSTHFLQCAALAGTVPVHRLRWPLAFESLPATVRLIEEHLAGRTDHIPV